MVIEKLFFQCENKAVAIDSRKKTVRNAVNRGIISSSKKEVFRDVLLDLVGHFADPGHPGDVFDVGYVPFERSPEAAISRGAAARSLVAIV